MDNSYDYEVVEQGRYDMSTLYSGKSLTTAKSYLGGPVTVYRSANTWESTEWSINGMDWHGV